MTRDRLDVIVRRMTDADADAVREVVRRAFVDEPVVVALQDDLAARPDNVGLVAVHDGTVVGHVGLTRCWIDAPDQLVEALVVSPLSVAPEVQRQGVGRALLDAAIAHAREVGAPALFLEGDPAYYGHLGWQPAAELGVTPPSDRIPAPACQSVRLPGHQEWMRGRLVYADTFWAHDCVGLRGDRLADVRGQLG